MFELWVFPFFEILFFSQLPREPVSMFLTLGNLGLVPCRSLMGLSLVLVSARLEVICFYPPSFFICFLALIVAFSIDGYPLDGYYPGGFEILARGESFL